MDFSLSEEQQLYRDSVLRWERQELASEAVARMSDSYPRDVARKVAELGLIGITFAEAGGGAGGRLDAIITVQEVAIACPRSGDVIQTGNLGPIHVRSMNMQQN